MEWTTIIVSIISALAGGGLLSLLTIRETKKSKKLANTEKELELEDKKKDEVINDWRELEEQRKKNLEECQTRAYTLQKKLDEREIIISELRKRLDDVNSENVALNLIRCSKIQCSDRIPPFGFKEISIKDGRLVKEIEN